MQNSLELSGNELSIEAINEWIWIKKVGRICFEKFQGHIQGEINHKANWMASFLRQLISAPNEKIKIE